MSGDPICPEHGMFPCFCFYNLLSGHTIGKKVYWQDDGTAPWYGVRPAGKLDAKQLRNIAEEDCPQLTERNPIIFIADNVYDTFNVGGIFRLCDALAAEKLFICGNSPVPPNPKIKSSSSGTYKCVPWSYHQTTLEAINFLRAQDKNTTIIAVEQPPEKFSHKYLGSIYEWGELEIQNSIAFVVGCETGGIKDEVLEVVDGIIDIPMWGINKSLNVIVAASIVGYEVARRLGF